MKIQSAFWKVCLVSLVMVGSVLAENPQHLKIVIGENKLQLDSESAPVEIIINTEVHSTKISNLYQTRSLVSRLGISIAGKDLFIPPSASFDLYDLNTASLCKKKGGYTLELKGGDAAEGYNSTIVFNQQRVLQRIDKGETGNISQRIQYPYQPPSK